MAKMLYVASPIDRYNGGIEVNHQIAGLVTATPDWITYDPRMAFRVSEGTQPDNKIAHLNKVALQKSSALIAHLPKNAITVGVPMEIALAEELGIPVAWFGDDGWAHHWSLALRGIHRVDDPEEAVAFCLGRVASMGDSAEKYNYLRVQKLHRDAQLPTRAFSDDAGLDLYVVESTFIEPGKWADVPLGIAVQPPMGVWYRIVGRSSTFRKRRLLVIEGIIDHGYRGPLYVGVTNLSDKPVTVEVGERIAQMLPQYNIVHDAIHVEEVAPSERNGAGFGSSGT